MKKKTSLLEDPIFQTLVAAISVTIARLANLKTAGFFQEAYDEIDIRLEELIGLKADQIRRLSDSFIFDLVTVNEFMDVQRLWFVAELILAEADLRFSQGQESEGQASRTRALGLFMEVAFSAIEPIPEVSQHIDALYDTLVQDLPEEPLFSLYDYFEGRGDYAKAETALDQMIAVSGNNPDLLKEKDAFTLRLSQKSDTEMHDDDLIRP